MGEVSVSREASSSEGFNGRRGIQWRPRFDGSAVVPDLQRRVAGAQCWLGGCMHEGKRTIAQCVQSFEASKGMVAQRFQGLARRQSGENNREVNGQNPRENKLWMSLLGFGAHIEAQVHRSRSDIPEAMLQLVRNVNFRAPRPLFAALSLGFENRGEEVGAKHLFDIAMSTEQVTKRLDGVPVYTVSNSANEFVLISDLNTSRSLGIFCFREEDAEALLSQVKDREPSLGRGAKVVAVSLDKVYQLNAEGIAFRFLPDPRQVKNALEARAKAGDAGRAFDGVPVFQSDNLILRSNNRRFCPIFFSKEDLENALKRAFKQQQRVNPALRVNTDIQVGSFEDVLKRMEGNEEETGWGDIVFIPPGMDALSHLAKSHATVVG